MMFACEKAKSLAENNARSACGDDSVVYGWAIHYFDEDGIEGRLFNTEGTEYKPEPKPVQRNPAQSFHLLRPFRKRNRRYPFSK